MDGDDNLVVCRVNCSRRELITSLPLRRENGYRLAAQQGFANAQINLSNCFHNGLGVDKDESLATWWVSLAAEQGDVDAQLNLGTRFLNGIGVTKDAFEAFFWFNLAANEGSMDAISYKATAAKELLPDQAKDALRISQDASWRPKSAGDSALQIFKGAAGQTVDLLKQAVGEKRFGELKMTDKVPPSVGEVILAETHGIRPATIATNTRKLLGDIERNLDLDLSKVEDAEAKELIPSLSAMAVLGFIRRIDDLADVGTVLGASAVDFTHNLLEYHFSLIGELGERINPSSMAILLKRFSLKQALRAPGLLRYSGLHKALFPLLPWS